MQIHFIILINQVTIMKKLFYLFVCVSVVSLFASCGSGTGTEEGGDNDSTKVEAEHAGHDHDGEDHVGHDHGDDENITTLCLKCGEIAGSENCCKEGIEKCSVCGLNMDSPGCCSIPEGVTEAKICNKCGEIIGTENCCKEGVEKCEACGKHKGSIGCKIACGVDDDAAG